MSNPQGTPAVTQLERDILATCLRAEATQRAEQRYADGCPALVRLWRLVGEYRELSGVST